MYMFSYVYVIFCTQNALNNYFLTLHHLFVTKLTVISTPCGELMSKKQLQADYFLKSLPYLLKVGIFSGHGGRPLSIYGKLMTHLSFFKWNVKLRGFSRWGKKRKSGWSSGWRKPKGSAGNWFCLYIERNINIGMMNRKIQFNVPIIL